MKRLIIGCGYLGRRVARAWCERGDEVFAFRRSSDHAATFRDAGLQPIIGDVLDPASLANLPAAETVLYSVGYDRSAAPTKRQVYVDGLCNVMQALPDASGRLIYISSTSVYGQSHGESVDESSPCVPTSERGRVCLDAERMARESFPGTDGVAILRLSGIYGPRRLAARVDALLKQKPLDANPNGWLNLIHIDDACTVTVTCADLDTPPETLVVCDDEPLPRREYYSRIAAVIGAPPPVFDPSDRNDLGKRCSNRRLRESLGIELAYPTIADGLPTALSKQPR